MGDRDDVVLVVDDDECCREVIRAVLEEQFGISAFLARDGKEALHRVEVVRPVLVLLDMMMPGLNGMEVVRRLKENPTTAAIPVIGVSASTARDKAVEAGCDDYIRKPFDLDVLVAKVEHYLPSLSLIKRDGSPKAGDLRP